MRFVIFCGLLLLSTGCRSQQFVLRDFSDSMQNVDKGHVSKSFPAYKAIDINGRFSSDSLLKGK